jgi:predicted PurR-regulated permease PerM
LGFLGLLVAIPFTCLCLVYIQKLPKHDDDASDLPEPPPEAWF